MSGMALVWAANVRGLKPATKIVLIQLSERHNKDTSRCDPSIRLLADDCEMNRTTVMRHLEKLESVGLITRVSRGGDGIGRESNQYILHIPEDAKYLGAKSHIATGAKSQSDGGLSRENGGAKSQSYATQTCKEPVSEPSLFGSIEPHNVGSDDRFEYLWSVYPKAPNQSKKAAREKYKSALKKNINAEMIIDAAKKYAKWLDSGGPKDFRPNPKHLATWLSKEGWADDIPDVSTRRRPAPSHMTVVR